MKKTLIALAAVLALTSAAQADGWNHRGGYRGGYRGGGNWVAPLVGGLILGGALGAMAQPRYYEQRRPLVNECWIQPVYDRYGRYIGDERVCSYNDVD